MLAAEDMGRFASLGPGCVVIVVIGGFHWRPKALEQQHLRLGKTAVLRDMRLGDYFTPSSRNRSLWGVSIAEVLPRLL